MRTAVIVGLASAGVTSSSVPTLLRADGTNLLSLSSSERHAIARRDPTFTWSPPSCSRDMFDDQPSDLIAQPCHYKAQAAFRVELRSPYQAPNDDLVWDSGLVTSKFPLVRYSGASLQMARSYEWRVTTFASDSSDLNLSESSAQKINRTTAVSSAWSLFHVALSSTLSSANLQDDGWGATQWLGLPEAQGENITQNFHLLRTEFDVPDVSKISSVWAYVCGLGYSAVSFDGKEVDGFHLVSAPWTNGNRVNRFAAMDVTSLVKAATGGSAAVGVSLGYGWRDVHSFPPKDKPSGPTAPARVLRMKVVATMMDGSQQDLTHTAANMGWKYGAGPIVSDSVYDGETFDANIQSAIEGWNTVGSPVTKAWPLAIPLSNNTSPQGSMLAWGDAPVTIDRTLSPIGVTQPKPGIFVADFGANLAGVVKMSGAFLSQCKQGGHITIRHGEIMQHKGIPGLVDPDPTMIYTANLRSAKATDVYWCTGKPTDAWKPSHTYHGFRFAEINTTASGIAAVTAADVSMLHFHSNVQQRANATFSSATLNRLQTMALGAQRSNMMTVLTDCDQRDERLGWMGDLSLSSESVSLNYAAGSFLRFAVENIASELDGDGSLPDVVPFFRYGNRPADVSWSAALCSTIYALWKYQGDVQTAKRFYNDLARNLQNIKGQAAAGLANMHTPYGDWCPPPAEQGGGQGPKPSKPFTSAFSYLNMVRQMKELATALGNQTEVARLGKLMGELSQEFNTAFFNTSSGVYDNGLQTALVLPLALGITPSGSTTAPQLVKNIQSHTSHYTTGIIGFRFLFDVLFDMGTQGQNLAIAILEQTDYPSIGYYFANDLEPATENLWELPDAPAEGTGMNSRNHHMWSSYSSYLIRKIAGIDQSEESSGFSNVILRPGSTPLVSSASASIALPNGKIQLQWHRTGGMQMAVVSEGDALELDCGEAGGVISSIPFASFGTPMLDLAKPSLSSCQTAEECAAGWKQHPECYSPSFTMRVEDSCAGKTKCSVRATRDHIHDARCQPSMQPLRLAATAVCSGPPTLRVIATIPPSSSCVIELPTVLAAANASGSPTRITFSQYGSVQVPSKSSQVCSANPDAGQQKHRCPPVPGVSSITHLANKLFIGVEGGHGDLALVIQHKD